MAIPLVDLKAQYRPIQDEINAALARVFANTSFCLGPEVEAFEAAFAKYCGTDHAVGVSSGTAALQMALMGQDIGADDEVITTPHTFIATASAIAHTGATPVLVDIDPLTYNLDANLIEAAITPKTKAIIPVHLYGQPADMTAINAIAAAHNLIVIEDACQAVGAMYGDKRAGNLGHAACFSFYASKNLSAAGDGGILTTNDTDLADRVRKLRDHGRTSHYGHAVVGFTGRLDALQAAILGVKLPYLDDWNARRRSHAETYNALLASSDVVTPYEANGVQSVYHIYAVRTARRDEVLQALRDKGIGASIHYPLPVHLQPAYAYLGLGRGAYPVAETCADSVLSLPMYPEMTREQLATVANALIEIVG